MKRLEFFAGAAFAGHDDELGLHEIVLAQNESETAPTFELQLADAVDPQDGALGMDTYCLVVNASETHYGGVTAWQLVGRVFELSVDAQAAAALGIDGVRIELAQEHVAAVRQTAERIFKATQVPRGG